MNESAAPGGAKIKQNHLALVKAALQTGWATLFQVSEDELCVCAGLVV